MCVGYISSILVDLDIDDLFFFFRGNFEVNVIFWLEREVVLRLELGFFIYKGFFMVGIF